MDSQNATPNEAPEARGRVLVVDDVAANVRLLESMLLIEGYEVATADNGQDALDAISSAQPDVVLLDVMMPGMDGFETCRRLKADAGSANVPVVMVTALQATSDRVRALEAGADDFLTKPVDEVEVLARVKTLVRAKRDRDGLDQAFAELRATHEELRQTEAMRDSLADMLVHDLRTPLTTMLVSLELLHSSFAGETDAMQREVIALSLRGGQQLLTLVNDLLDISKMEGGHMTLHRAPVEVPVLVDEALATVSAQAHELGLTISSDLAPVPTLHADADLLRRVLINLLGNAVKFSSSGGHIEVSTAPFGDELELRVRDDGPGIALEDQARIFGKFEQAQLRQSGRKLSTGLGLTFCKLAVEAHGGRIWVESQLDQGSTFLVRLPLGDAV